MNIPKLLQTSSFALSLLTSCLLLFTENTQAATIIDTTFWKCTAYDAQNRKWAGHSDYKLTSYNKAFEACKKQSKIPTTCKISKENCEAIVNGITTRPMFRCIALDYTATPWPSNLYDKASKAYNAAKAYCKANSALPETCYVYLFTCRNLNQRII